MQYLTTSATLKCCHGGTVKIPTGMTRIKLDGVEVVAREAIIGAPILGCPNFGPGLVPCTAVVSVLAGASPGVRVGGLTPLVKPATGMTNGSPPGVWQVNDTGQSKVKEGAGGGGGLSAAPPSPPPPPPATPAPAAAKRNPKWKTTEAKLGDKVVATWKPALSDRGSAEVTIWEHHADGKRRLGSVRASAQKGEAVWEVSYPVDGPTRPTTKPFAEVFFEVKVASGTSFHSPREDGAFLKVWAELRFRVTDPDGKPLPKQACQFTPHGGATLRVETNDDGCARVENIHPGAPGLYLTGRHGQMILTGEGKWVEEEACRVPDHAAAADALRQAIDQLKRAEVVNAIHAEMHEYRLLMEEMLAAVEAEGDDWQMTKKSANYASVATVGLLATDITVVGTADDILIPVAWAVVAGAAVVNVGYWLSRLPWRAEKSRQTAHKLQEITRRWEERQRQRRTVPEHAPTPEPAPELPVPTIPPIELKGPPSSKKQTDPKLVPITPTIPATDTAPQARRRREPVPLLWPMHYLPRPHGWKRGTIVRRSVVRSKVKRGSAKNQAHVNTLIHFVSRMVFEESRRFENYIPRTAALLTEYGASDDVIREVRLAKKFANHPLLRQPDGTPHKEFARRVRSLPDEVFDVPRREVGYDAESQAYGVVGGGAFVLFDAHHVLPLCFEGGGETFDNLCVLDYDAHTRGHRLLFRQPHWVAYGLSVSLHHHPPGQRYALEYSFDRWNGTTDDLTDDEDWDPDHWEWGEP